MSFPKVRVPYLLLLPGFAFLFTFFILPIINLAQTSTQTPVAGGDTGEYEQTLAFGNYIQAFVENKEQFGRSFLYASLATIFALAIAYPLAYAIAFKSGKFKNILLVLVVAPFFTSFLLRTIAWKQILGEEGFVVPGLRNLNIIGEQTTLTSTSIAVVAGMTYNFLPFMTLPLYASLERIDPRTIEAAGDLYANGITAFRRVTVPLSLPGVVAGTLLTFIPAAGDYVNAAILGSPNTKMIGNVIESRYFKIVDYPTAAALSFTLMAAILILVTLYILKSGKFKNILLVLVVAPFFTSFLLRTIAWKQILGEEGFVVPGLRNLNIIGEQTTLTSTSIAVVAGMTYNFLPFMTLPLYASLERIDPRTIEAAGDLYANGITAFRRVTVPLSMPGVVAGTLLTFIPAAGDYVNAAILGSPNTKMIGNVIESRYFKIVDYPTAAALSFTLMAAILILVTLYIRKAGTEELV